MDPLKLGCDCKSCPHAVNNAPGQTVWGETPKDSPIQGILVGDAPTKEDVDKGRPFGGSLGVEVRAELRAAGIDPRTILFLNAVLCPHPGKPNDKDLLKAAKCCRPALLVSLSMGGPLPVLACGKGAAYGISGRNLPNGGLQAARGFIREIAPSKPRD